MAHRLLLVPRMRQTLLLSLSAACALAACTSDAPLDPATDPAPLVPGPFPEAPALQPDVHLIEGGAFLRPHIPPLRATADGRVAVSLDKRGGDVGFYLFVPEKLTTSWIDSPDGVTVLASHAPVRVPNLRFYEDEDYRATAGGAIPNADHRTICDGWPIADAPHPTNPYPCDGDEEKDCYDVTVVSVLRLADDKIELHGKPVRVKVAAPKTSGAYIAEVVTDHVALGDERLKAIAGDPLPARYGFELTTTRDGRLLVLRIGDTPYGLAPQDNPAWVNPITGATRTGKFEIMYSAYGAADAPCDVTRWDALHPITHAFWDRSAGGVHERYGFAFHQLRDAKGTYYGDGEELGGSYPWIDRDGDNLFFTLISSTLFHGDDSSGVEVLNQRYASACVDGEPCVAPTTVAEIGDRENAEQFRGFGFAGLWSRGKTVMLDNLANNTDYGLGSDDDEHRMLALYDGAPVRVGTGRDNDEADRPPGAVANTSFIDSWENLFNHDPEARPTTVRDVVWIMNSGKASVEVAFDDYLDGDAIIVSEMTGATRKTPPSPWIGDGGLTNQPTYLDGFVQDGVHRARWVGEIEIANAATSKAWNVPASGLGVGGNPHPRLEPVAMGGIVGKGLWLHGGYQGLYYEIPAQPAIPEATTIALFIDPRTSAGTRALLTFPDGTEVDLVGQTDLVYRRGAETITVPLGGTSVVRGGWNHLAWVVRDGGRTIDLFRDGYPFARTTTSQPMFQLFSPSAPGVFRVGYRTGATGFRGWIDEVKVFARDVGVEPICNHARGTMIRIPASGASPAWWVVAGRYATHGAIRNLLGDPSETSRYACFRDYARPELPLLRNLPGTTASVRDALLLSGPLYWDAPRPPSYDNAFCLSCHTTWHPALSEAALELDDGGPGGTARDAIDDPRRQPMQPPPRVHGNVPAGFFGVGSPAYHDGRLIDRYVLPAAPP